ncbi:MAG: AraC family transcriptional regulator [Prolixibacteraceae bacterium]|nr:AraC family transcriptional regulator [Prolixibacteraceae bacterium]
MKLFIKYMVSMRCKMVVKSELDKLGLHYTKIELGEVEVMENLTEEQLKLLKYSLLQSGLELMDNQKSILIEKIKNTILEMVLYNEEMPKINFSEHLSNKLKHDYTYLANLFSEVTGVTIEHYIIIHKIERVKELILFDELNLTEIAFKLNYSSVAHLSNQFKKITGLTPTFFKYLRNKKITALNDV